MAAQSLDSPSLGASLIDLPVTHEHPLRHGHHDANFDLERTSSVPGLDWGVPPVPTLPSFADASH